MSYVRAHYRRSRYGYRPVRSHYRRRSRRAKTNFFYANQGAFVAGGLSKKHGPFLTVGYKKGPVKLKTSIGLEGHKISGSVKPTRNTEVGIQRNLTFNKTNTYAKYRNKKINL